MIGDAVIVERRWMEQSVRRRGWYLFGVLPLYVRDDDYRPPQPPLWVRHDVDLWVTAGIVVAAVCAFALALWSVWRAL